MQYYRGDKTWQTLTSTAVAEGTNLFYTDARARTALAPGAPLSYNSSTGVLTLPAAASGTDGYLAAGDWTTFNSKQPAISAASTVNTGTLTTGLQLGVGIGPYNTAAGQTGELRFNELAASGINFVGFKADFMPNLLFLRLILCL